MTYPFHRETLLSVSLQHVMPHDARLLNTLATSPRTLDFPGVNAGLVAKTPDGGYILWIGDDGIGDGECQELAALGFSPAFGFLLGHVHEAAGGFCRVLLEPDREPVDGLPTFEA